MPDLSAAHQEMMRLSRLIGEGVNEMRRQAGLYAEAEHDYRLAKSRAWIEAPREVDGFKITAGEREAWVDAKTADERKQRDIADGLRQTALEAVRSRRTQLSALQSYLAAERAEAEFARTGPR
jgi:hypothetical protein